MIKNILWRDIIFSFHISYSIQTKYVYFYQGINLTYYYYVLRTYLYEYCTKVFQMEKKIFCPPYNITIEYV